MKFGGSSVASLPAIRQVAKIIAKAKKNRPVVMVSALAGITNLLLKLAKRDSQDHTNLAVQDLRAIKDQHQEVLKGFPKSIRKRVAPKISNLLTKLQKTLELGQQEDIPPKTYADFLASFGERLSSWLLMGALLEQGLSATRLDSRDLIITDSHFGAAEVNFQKTQRLFKNRVFPLIKKHIIPVITGFIGATAGGLTTTLGRGGSDYSAAIAALCLDAKEIQIWKDVPGFMTADPRIVKTARVIPKLSFDEAAELSYFGAKLLHPKTIYPAVQKNIPVRILNTFAPTNSGTMIFGILKKRDSQQETKQTLVTAIAVKKGIAVINVVSLKMLAAYGFLAKLFQIFAQHSIAVDVLATSEASVSMTIEETVLSTSLMKDLKKIGMIQVIGSQAILSIVGCGLKSRPEVEASVFTILKEQRITTEMISKGASEINLTCIVNEACADHAVRALHDVFFISKK